MNIQVIHRTIPTDLNDAPEILSTRPFATLAESDAYFRPLNSRALSVGEEIIEHLENGHGEGDRDSANPLHKTGCKVNILRKRGSTVYLHRQALRDCIDQAGQGEPGEPLAARETKQRKTALAAQIDERLVLED